MLLILCVFERERARKRVIPKYSILTVSFMVKYLFSLTRNECGDLWLGQNVYLNNLAANQEGKLYLPRGYLKFSTV